jgi:hypothetical protein
VDFLDELRRSIRDDAEVKQGLDDLAKEALAYCKENSPIESGDFAAGWRIGRTKKDKDGNPIRRITNTSPGAVSIEYGTSDTPKHGVIARAETHFGANG